MMFKEYIRVPQVDRLWVMYGIYQGSFKDHVLSTPGWLSVYYDGLVLFLIPAKEDHRL